MPFLGAAALTVLSHSPRCAVLHSLCCMPHSLCCVACRTHCVACRTHHAVLHAALTALCCTHHAVLHAALTVLHAALTVLQVPGRAQRGRSVATSGLEAVLVDNKFYLQEEDQPAKKGKKGKAKAKAAAKKIPSSKDTIYMRSGTDAL